MSALCFLNDSSLLGLIPYRCMVCDTAALEQLTDSAISTGVAGVVAVSVRIASALLPGLGRRGLLT